jgi:hypothetical protein
MSTCGRSIVIVAAVATGLLAWGGCGGEGDDNRPAAGRVITKEAPAGVQDSAQTQPDEEPVEDEGDLAVVDDAETRYESGKPDELEGLEQAAAPLRYATTTIRMRGHVQDTLDAAQATRALLAYKALEDELPESIKDLRKWGDENGYPVPEPADGGVYVLNKSKTKLVIVDPEQLDK